jgi:hypothetical protein
VHREILEEARRCQYVILSRGPWAGQEGVEMLFEDGSDNPYTLHFTVNSFDMLPADPGPGQEWVMSFWEDGPRKAVELPCHWRRVPRLPWLKPLEG